MNDSREELVAHILARTAEVCEALGVEPAATLEPHVRFADVLDSMGMVELLSHLADDCATTPDAIERCVDRRFSTMAELAHAMSAAGLLPRVSPPPARASPLGPTTNREQVTSYLGATAVRLPTGVQTADEIDALLGRPPGWLQEHAGIHERRVWQAQGPLEAAADAARECLAQTSLRPAEVGALLVTSEAPPQLLGFGAELHRRLELQSAAPAFEIGGACTGFLASLRLGQSLLGAASAVLVIAIECPSRWLQVAPGPAGEAAALFGDAAAACIVSRDAMAEAYLLGDVTLRVDGTGADLLRVGRTPTGVLQLHMDGGPLAVRAVGVMAEQVRTAAARRGVSVADLACVVVHGGNGRMPALLARRLGLPSDRVWSQTARCGNLGSASLPVAWASRPRPAGLAVWTAVGAGLTWGAVAVETGAKENPPSGTIV